MAQNKSQFIHFTSRIVFLTQTLFCHHRIFFLFFLFHISFFFFSIFNLLTLRWKIESLIRCIGRWIHNNNTHPHTIQLFWLFFHSIYLNLNAKVYLFVSTPNANEHWSRKSVLTTPATRRDWNCVNVWCSHTKFFRRSSFYYDSLCFSERVNIFIVSSMRCASAECLQWRNIETRSKATKQWS